jgi:hypothetical protein
MPADYTVFVVYLPTAAVIGMSIIDANFAVGKFPLLYAYVPPAPGADNPLPAASQETLAVADRSLPSDYEAVIADSVLDIDVATFEIDALFAVKNFPSRFSLVSSAAPGPPIPMPPITPPVMLGVLSLSAWTFSVGAAQGVLIGTIIGATAGSTLSLANSAGGAVQLAGNALQIGPTAPAVPGELTIQIKETLAGAVNSGNVTSFAIVETPAGGFPILGLILDMRDSFPCQLFA